MQKLDGLTEGYSDPADAMTNIQPCQAPQRLIDTNVF